MRRPLAVPVTYYHFVLRQKAAMFQCVRSDGSPLWGKSQRFSRGSWMISTDERRKDDAPWVNPSQR